MSRGYQLSGLALCNKAHQSLAKATGKINCSERAYRPGIYRLRHGLGPYLFRLGLLQLGTGTQQMPQGLS